MDWVSQVNTRESYAWQEAWRLGKGMLDELRTRVSVERNRLDLLGLQMVAHGIVMKVEREICYFHTVLVLAMFGMSA